MSCQAERRPSTNRKKIRWLYLKTKIRFCINLLQHGAAVHIHPPTDIVFRNTTFHINSQKNIEKHFTSHTDVIYEFLTHAVQSTLT